MKRLLILTGAASLMAACSEAPMAPPPQAKSPAARPNLDITCRSGYIVAYREDGTEYCAPDPGAQMRVGIGGSNP
jgi:hypothetical protein